jgi:hypothetical protein
MNELTTCLVSLNSYRESLVQRRISDDRGTIREDALVQPMIGTL